MQTDPIHLWAVRRWAAQQGISRSKFLAAYRSAYCLSVARLVQAVYRERLCEAHLAEHPLLAATLTFGSSASLLVPIVPLPFVRLDVRAWPPCYRTGVQPADLKAVKWAGAFLRELRRLLRNSAVSLHLAELASDFQNSLSNLILSRLLGVRPAVARRALEPAYQGHHYYPFPGLRVGPSIDHVVACSNLNTKSANVPLLELGALTFRSTVYANAEDCFAAWSNIRLEESGHTIPVHPWQLEISPVVEGLISANAARLLPKTIPCMPLASQRTLRVAATGFDIKLSVNASLTSEHRLLYRLNCENAPAVSALVRRLLRAEGSGLAFDVQSDVASLAFGDDQLAPHLSAIVRAPLPVRLAREQAVPAIELWTGRKLAKHLLRDSAESAVHRFFKSYCRIVMSGPIAFLIHFGLAFEPHLQNSVIVFRSGKPVRLILRDLDGTVMERKRVAAFLRALDLRVAPDTWDHMPSSEIGESRIMHALFFGHLGEVIDFLVTQCAAQEDALLSLLAGEWERLPLVVNQKGTKRRLDALAAHLESGKTMLVGRLKRSASMQFVKLPDHPALPSDASWLSGRRR
jgi:hypothetical protein